MINNVFRSYNMAANLHFSARFLLITEWSCLEKSVLSCYPNSSQDLFKSLTQKTVCVTFLVLKHMVSSFDLTEGEFFGTIPEVDGNRR